MLSQMLADYAAANESGKQDMFEEAAERMITAEKGLRYASGKLEAQASRLQAIEATAHKVAERQREEEEEKEREQMEYRAAQRNQKKQKTNPGYVYLVGAENGNYKIGKAKNVDERVNTFGVKLPIKTWLVHSFSSNDYSKAEAVLHEQFSEKRTHGEWFLLADEDVEYIKALQDGAL
jgi:hypothetical protein